MLFFSSSSAHQRACAWKQKERQSQIDSLPAAYFESLSPEEEKIHSLSLAQLVSECHSGALEPSTIMATYAKKALVAHQATNCLTDIMFEDALGIPPVANWAPGVDNETTHNESTRERSLLGVPVSIKDTVNIEGHDTTIGYSRNVGRPSSTSSAIVRLLQDAGALVHAKTTVPPGLLAIETASDIFGRTSNPYNLNHTAGASTGGGGALVAAGGSKIEIGTDIAGSVRIPAHFCGIWSLKGSSGRFPVSGTESSMKGLEGLPIVASPMAGSLEDLKEFWKRVVHCEPWQYDHTCIPLPWQTVNLQDEGRKLKWGIVWEDGTMSPTPACRRALETVVSALKKQGHEVVEFQPPNIAEGLQVGYELLFSDGGRQVRSGLSPGEKLSEATQSILDVLALPRFVKKILSYLTRKTDPIGSLMCDILHEKTALEDRENIAARDEYRAKWHRQWTEEGLDFVLTVPHLFPALEHGGSTEATLSSASFSFLVSLLDYTAGVLPVTYVDCHLDALPHDFEKSAEYQTFLPQVKTAYKAYDADKMHGLPLGVQVVGRRLEEEKVLEGMEVIQNALREQGSVFVNKVKI